MHLSDYKMGKCSINLHQCSLSCPPRTIIILLSIMKSSIFVIVTVFIFLCLQSVVIMAEVLYLTVNNYIKRTNKHFSVSPQPLPLQRQSRVIKNSRMTGFYTPLRRTAEFLEVPVKSLRRFMDAF